MSNFGDIALDEWKRVLAIHLDGLFMLTQTFVPHMCERGWGRVVGISSQSVFLGPGSPMGIHYVCAKMGVIGFIRCLAADVGRYGVTVNAIAPGLIHTPGTDRLVKPLGAFEFVLEAQAIKRSGMPDDITGTLAFLVSDDASWMTGQTLLVDGGLARH
jgi:NAD(P)-dependent dehydrogenase (short-subunit alcohol dehydrogenase family)